MSLPENSYISKYSGRYDTPGLMNFFVIYQYSDRLVYEVEATPQFHDSTSETYEQTIQSLHLNGPLLPLSEFDEEEKKELMEWISTIQ